jgi:sensor domain CHASE-containing protein
MHRDPIGSDPAPPPDSAKRSVIEQHAQSVLLAVITAAVIFSGTFVVQAREDSVRVATQLAAMANEISALRAQLASMQSNYVGRDDFRDHEARLRNLERTVRPRAE